MLRLDLKAGATPRPGAAALPPGTGRRGAGGSTDPVPPGAGMSASWWTARARAGEVTAGFRREAIVRPAPEDPRAPGGLFERVAELLSAMLDRM